LDEADAADLALCPLRVHPAMRLIRRLIARTLRAALSAAT